MDAENAAKRENCKFIGDYTREEISKGCDWIHTQKQDGGEFWGIMNIDRCIGAIKEANTVKACHQIYDKSKALPELPASKEFSRGQIDNLRGLFP